MAQLEGPSNGVYFRETLCEVLNEMSTGKQLENQDCMQTVADLIKVTLTCLHKEPNPKLFYTILESSVNLFTILNGTRKHYLWTLLSDHPAWGNIQAWQQCAIEITQMKIEEAKKR